MHTDMDIAELTPDQREELYQLLLAEQVRLEAHFALSEEGSKPVQLGTPIGRLSRMDAIQQQQMTRASRSTLEVKRRQVEASLAEHAKGVYGECRSCEEPIGYPRLRARPEAPFCLSCQDSKERSR
jgi:DnaK suppressor protein